MLEEQKIRYAVLRNYEQLPESTGGSDIDMWVAAEDCQRFFNNTIDIAKQRCRYHNCVLLLASATPSVESYYYAEKGIYKLIKNGATIVTEGEDILNALNWEIKSNNNEQQLLNLDLNSNEESIIESVEIEPKGFDSIQNETKISTEDLLMCLTTLELKGIIKQVEGDRYQKV